MSKLISTSLLLWVLIGFNAKAGNSKYYRSDELSFAATYNSWLLSTNQIKTQNWPSIGFDVNWVFDIPFQKDSPFSFAFGLGYSIHHVYHNADLRLNSTNVMQNGTFELRPLGTSYSVNKFATNYIELPVELRFRTLTKHAFRFYPGFKAGYMAVSYNKYSDANTIYKTLRIPNLNRLRYGPTLKVGFGMFNLSGFYGMNSLFDKGIVVQEFSLGLTVFAN